MRIQYVMTDYGVPDQYGAVVDDAVFGLGAHPLGREVDLGIGLDRVIAEEIETQKGRHRSCGVGGQVEEQIHTRAIGAEMDADLAAAGPAGERLAFFEDRTVSVGQRAGHFAVDMRFEELEYFRPTLLGPGGGIADGAAAGRDQRVGQCVLWDLVLVVVGFVLHHDLIITQIVGMGCEDQRVVSKDENSKSALVVRCGSWAGPARMRSASESGVR